RAQEPGRRYRLGGLTPSPRDAPHYAALFDQLRQLGFIEGQNLTIDWRGFGARTEQFRDIAVELLKAKSDVIFCAGDIAVRAAQPLLDCNIIPRTPEDNVPADSNRPTREPRWWGRASLTTATLAGDPALLRDPRSTRSA